MRNNTSVKIKGTMKNSAVISKFLVPIRPILMPKLPMLSINDIEISLLVSNLTFNILFGIKSFFVIYIFYTDILFGY